MFQLDVHTDHKILETLLKVEKGQQKNQLKIVKRIFIIFFRKTEGRITL